MTKINNYFPQKILLWEIKIANVKIRQLLKLKIAFKVNKFRQFRIFKIVKSPNSIKFRINCYNTSSSVIKL